MTTRELADIDKRVLWHPFTQQRGWCAEEPLIIERAQGCTLYDTDGNAYVDGVSSLWCNVHGHGHPAIDRAVREQLERVAHSTMLGLSHPGAIELARRLVALAPRGLSRVFYSDNGSTAAEVALKMAFQYWQHRGEPDRSGFICLRDGYHGDTIGSVSVGGIETFHACFGPLLFDAWQARPGDAEHLSALLGEHAGEVAAVIVEPLVQGAAGILTHPDGYLRDVRALCDEHDVLLICDEVATGFGRTGTMFACEQEDLRTFFHGHTYTGNPLACAAALATLDVFERERTLEALAPKIELLGELLEELVAPLDAVAEIRRRGFMVGIELGGFPAAARMGHQVTLAARRRGAVIRPLGDVVVLMPPLAIGEEQLRHLVAATAASVAEATATPVLALLA
jgi:adenosylmethionine-8-amino-7-oxononanoate aminotransferase